MKWFEQLTQKQLLHWVTNSRSGAAWPEIWPDMEIPKTQLPKRVWRKRKVRNKIAKMSRRRNRG